MSLVFKTPKSTLNTTSKAIQNLGGDCPPCPEPVLESTSEEYTRNGEYTLTPEEGVDGFSQVDITVNVPSDVNNQNKTVNPSTSSQSVQADSGYSGLGTVTVNPVTSSIDANIQAENILDGVTILGVTGTDLGYQAGYDEGEAAGETAGYQSGYEAGYEQGQSECPEPTLSNLSITPSTNAQEYNPAISGVDGYSLVSVSAVTSAIDQNITAGNIKNGVTILGVQGSFEGGSLQNKTVNPGIQQTVTADNGYYGLGTVTVNGVRNYSGSFTAGNVGEQVFAPDPQRADYFTDVTINVPIRPLGSFENPYYSAASSMNNMQSNDYDTAIFSMEIESCIGYYQNRIIRFEDIEGNIVAIKPFYENPEYDPEDPTSEQFIYANADTYLVGKKVSVVFDKSDVTFNEENGQVVSVTIDNAQLIAVNDNENQSTYFVNPINLYGLDSNSNDFYIPTDQWNNITIYSTEPWTAATDSETLQVSTDGQMGISNFAMFTEEEEEATVTITQVYSGEEFIFTVHSTPETFRIVSLADQNTVSFYKPDGFRVDLWYKINDGDWDEASFEAASDPLWEVAGWELNSDDVIYFKGDNDKFTSGVANGTDFCFFASTDEVNVSGPIASLLSTTNYLDEWFAIQAPYAFDRMFSKQTIDGNDLELMVIDFTAELPSNISRGCFANMFKDNDSLETVDSDFGAITLTPYCEYHMFDGCTNLISVPWLPDEKVTLAPYCYAGMFKGCTNMTWNDEEPRPLPAKYLEEGCYQEMFKGCESLDIAPELPALTLVENCYKEMFSGCTALESVTCYAEDISATNCTTNWLYNVAQRGEISVVSTANWTSDSPDGTPVDWTVTYIDM